MTTFRRMLVLVVSLACLWPAGVRAAGPELRRVRLPAELIHLVKPIRLIGPLQVVDPKTAMWRQNPAWDDFRLQLREARSLGATAVEIDIWWGLVQAQGPDSFNWEYYDYLFEIVDQVSRETDGHGTPLGPISVIPTFSHHQLGGYAGDGAMYIPLPKWLRDEMVQHGLAYVDEHGRTNLDTVSIFATKHLMPRYRRFWQSFLDRFGSKYHHLMPRVIIGMGPAGEAALPITPQHPHRGLLFANSDVAQNSFRAWLRQRYETIEKLNESWGDAGIAERWRRLPEGCDGTSYRTFDDVTLLRTHADADALFHSRGQYSQPGKDFFEWLHDTLVEHVFSLMKNATEVFQAQGSPLRGAVMAYKVPGIHWEWFHHSRTALLTSGLVHPRSAAADFPWPADWRPDKAEGLEDFLKKTFFKIAELYPKQDFPHVKWEAIFTAAELGDDHAADSGAKELAYAFARWCERHHLDFSIENAQQGRLYDRVAVNQIADILRQFSHCTGVSLLRMKDALSSDAVREILFGEGPQACAYRMFLISITTHSIIGNLGRSAH